MAKETTLRDILSILPEGTIPTDARERLEALFEEMDQLLFLDHHDELAVDRRTLIRIANNEAFLPVHVRDIVLVESSKHLGRRVREFKDDAGRRIPWQEGWKYGLPGRVMRADEIRALGITEQSGPDEMEGAVRGLVPDVPSFWTNGDSPLLAEQLVRQLEVNRTVWDCLVANLGFWAALTFIGGAIILLILLGSGVPWPVALLIAGIYQTGATLYFILQCAANPDFQQR